MKKITLLIALVLTTLGFSQVPKIDFESNGAASIKGVNLSTATVGSGTGTNTTMVANLSKGEGRYDNPFEIILKNQISFATTGVKTITFDFYQATAIARPILVKVEAGTGDTFATNGYEVQVNTTATAGWQTLSFNFASCRESYPQTGTNKNIVGSYKKMYILIDFGLAPASTAAIDNITGGSQGAPIVVVADPAPTTAAPTPPARNAVDVISLFSNAYTNKTIENWSANYDTADISDVVIAGNDTKKVNFTNFLGVQFTTPANRIDATPMTNFHIDLWIPSSTATLDKSFNLKLSNWAKGSGQANSIDFSTTNASTPSLPRTNPGTWITLDIPLSSFSAGARNDIAEFLITAPVLGLVYIDNIYLWRDPLPAGTPTISFTIPEKSVSDAAFSLTSLITSNSPGAITYSSSNDAVARVSGSTVTIVGVGSTTITANQAAGGAFNAASKTAVLDVNPIAAPIPPTVTPSSVIGIYGETYPVTGYIDGFGSVGTADLDTGVGVNNALKYNFANGGYGQTFATKDISTMGFVHFDYYTTNATAFKLFMISANPTIEAPYAIPNITQNQWVGVNVPMSVFTNNPSFKATDFFQFKFDVDAVIPGTVYIDNLYFSITNPALGTEKFEASKVKMYPNPAKNTLNIDANGSIQKVSVYNILGQEVLSKKPNSNSTTLQTSGLQRGTYIVRSTVDGKTSTTKLIKE
ncbi:MAG: T9SS type A sorting domain-containing protein [Flavobacterium sp.]|nr:T9SS type A sorting domain-containing protein [Flavobacterium sp.]